MVGQVLEVDDPVPVEIRPEIVGTKKVLREQGHVDEIDHQVPVDVRAVEPQIDSAGQFDRGPVDQDMVNGSLFPRREPDSATRSCPKASVLASAMVPPTQGISPPSWASSHMSSRGKLATGSQLAFFRFEGDGRVLRVSPREESLIEGAAATVGGDHQGQGFGARVGHVVFAIRSADIGHRGGKRQDKQKAKQGGKEKEITVFHDVIPL